MRLYRYMQWATLACWIFATSGFAKEPEIILDMKEDKKVSSRQLNIQDEEKESLLDDSDKEYLYSPDGSSYATGQISNAKFYLKQDVLVKRKLEQQEKVQKFLKKLNRYQLCPTFYMGKGPALVKQLKEKFDVEAKTTLGDWILAVPTVIFSDPLILLTGITIGTTLAAKYWLPSWQQKATTKAYNMNMIGGDAIDAVCYGPDYCNSWPFDNNCFLGTGTPCNQYISGTGPYTNATLTIQPSSGFCGVMSKYCADVATSGLELVKQTLLKGSNVNFINPASNINGTYTSYAFQTCSGSNQFKWIPIQLSRNLQAAAEQYPATVSWGLTYTGTVVGALFVLMIYNFCFNF